MNFLICENETQILSSIIIIYQEQSSKWRSHIIMLHAGQTHYYLLSKYVN